MKQLIKQNGWAMDIAVFFSSPSGAVGSTLFLIVADCVMNAFAIGEIFGVRIEAIASGANVNWVAFAFAMFITIGLSFAIIASFILLKIDTDAIEDGKKKQLAKMANDKLEKLGQTLCNFSAIISLMSVGIYLFKGVSYETLLEMVKTPIFYCQMFLFLPIAIGVPRAISGFSRYIYNKYNEELLNANTIIMERVNNSIEAYRPVKKEEPENKIEQSGLLKLRKRLEKKTA